MTKKNLKFVLPLLFIALVIFNSACKKDPEAEEELIVSPESYDKAGMLTNMANNYIVPAYSTYKVETESLKDLASTFVTTPTIQNLENLRSQWQIGLLTWQDIAFLEFGPAEGISLRGQTNVYPTDTTLINDNIAVGTFNLQLPTNFPAKGFQALDFLLYRPGYSDQALVNFYSNNSGARDYLLAVATELLDNANYVLTQWQSSYSTSFINNNESNSQGSSVSNILNSLSLHYESFVRKGKIGLPAGAFNGFSQAPMPDHTEAFYLGSSLPFAVREMQAISKYINGYSYEENTNGEGLDDYLIYLSAQYNGENLSAFIENQINTIISNLNGLNDPLSNEVLVNSQEVADVYQSMQMLVPSIKVEMTSALGVLITYQDSDGD
jgi:predicted lipoprotein